MELLRPSFLGVEMPEEHHHESRKLIILLRRNRIVRARFIEDRRCYCFTAEIGVTVIQAVIGETASHEMEIIMPIPQRIEEISESTNVLVAGGFESAHPIIELCRI